MQRRLAILRCIADVVDFGQVDVVKLGSDTVCVTVPRLIQCQTYL